MSKKIKKIFIISSITVIIIVAIISTFFIVKYFSNQAKINNVLAVYSDDYVQEVENTEILEHNNLLLQIDGENVIGVIEIEKINFKSLVYEGTSLNTLAKGVGHFEHSPYLDGNVCLAAHNTNKYWAKLHTLESGDNITYTSFLGTKEYKVFNVTQINETDWNLLQKTDKNILTLITCVKQKPSKRLCVQALQTQ